MGISEEQKEYDLLVRTWKIESVDFIERLIKSQQLLSALEAAGVKNWEGYELAVESICEIKST